MDLLYKYKTIITRGILEQHPRAILLNLSIVKRDRKFLGRKATCFLLSSRCFYHRQRAIISVAPNRLFRSRCSEVARVEEQDAPRASKKRAKRERAAFPGRKKKELRLVVNRVADRSAATARKIAFNARWHRPRLLHH